MEVITNAAAIKNFLNHNTTRPVDNAEYMTFYKSLTVEERNDFGDYARANTN